MCGSATALLLPSDASLRSSKAHAQGSHVLWEGCWLSAQVLMVLTWVRERLLVPCHLCFTCQAC